MRTWDDWHNVHQPFELSWWRRHLSEGHSSGAGWVLLWDAFREFIQPMGDVIDIGCGPRPPFPGSTVIEPLADEYRQIPEVDPRWWLGIKVYSKPAENFIEGLRGDTIVCWNCLDHAIGWRKILENMIRYGNEGARLAVATDFFPPFEGHPGFPRDEFEKFIADHFVIIRRREKTKDDAAWRELSLVLEARR